MAKMTVTYSDEQLQAIKEYLIPHFDECYKKAMKAAAPDIREGFVEICSTAVRRYYANYTPRVYKRTRSLFDMYKFVLKGDQMEFLLDGDLSDKTHRIPNDYIFDVMFKLGQHGGAKPKPENREPWMSGNDGYYWRYPSPGSKAAKGGEANGTKIKPFSEWYKDPAHGKYEHEVGFPAPREKESPYQEIVREWHLYANNEGPKVILSAFKKILSDLIMEAVK